MRTAQTQISNGVLKTNPTRLSAASALGFVSFDSAYVRAVYREAIALSSSFRVGGVHRILSIRLYGPIHLTRTDRGTPFYLSAPEYSLVPRNRLLPLYSPASKDSSALTDSRVPYHPSTLWGSLPFPQMPVSQYPRAFYRDWPFQIYCPWQIH